MPNPDMFGPASMVLSSGIGHFQSFLPKLSEVRKSSGDPDLIGDVRMGEIAAAALTIGMGAIASSIVGDPLPTFVAAIVAAALIFLYELALRGNKPFQPRESMAEAARKEMEA